MLEALLKRGILKHGGELQVMDSKINYQNHHRANGPYNQLLIIESKTMTWNLPSKCNIVWLN